MDRPLIGITCSRCVGGKWSTYSLAHFMDYAFDAYSRAVLAVGGAPLLLPIAQNKSSMEAVCKSLGGLILTGGPDINPRAYHQEPLIGLKEIDDAADQMEIAFARLALQRDLPILGICRGLQVLNVAMGGSLYQDLATQKPDAINHTPAADRAVHTHHVCIEPGTRLHGILQRRRLWVNSQHHQAIRDPAAELVPSAHAADGVIEAAEAPRHRFVVAVQWHPEGLWPSDPAARRLFKALIQAAGGP